MKTVKSLTVFILFFGLIASSWSSLLVTPTRVTFDARDRVHEVTLVNTSNEPRQYKLEWIQNTQLENNQYARLTETEIESFDIASPYIRFSPRRVTLQPKESQKIKLLARRKADMSAPEYRSHLRFTAMPPELFDADDEEEANSGLQLKLNLLLSYTIPVVLRNEEPSVDVNIESVSFTPLSANNKAADASVVVSRKGNVSLYGNMTLYHRANANEEFEPVGYTNGVNVFHERDRNSIVIPWTEKPYVSGGEIKVTFEGSKEMTNMFYAEKTLELY